jgi:sugar/nucleoside kinase (ribokinase family)
VLRAARAAGALTSLDTAFDRSGGWFRTLAPCFEHLDVLMANDQEAAGLSGSQDPERAARFFLEHGVRYAVVKLGEQGCLVMSASETHRLPAHSVSVVDTTGAGDAFAAGFLLGLLEGRSLRACAALGNAAGARCVSHIGAAAFPIAREDLAALL